jgi:hypothetical protein
MDFTLGNIPLGYYYRTARARTQFTSKQLDGATIDTDDER